MIDYKTAKEEILGTYSLEEFEDIVEHGCAAGTAKNHLYLTGNVKFFDDYKNEIIQYVTESFGEDFLKEIFDSNEGDMQEYKNDIAWSFIEIIAGEEVDKNIDYSNEDEGEEEDE